MNNDFLQTYTIPLLSSNVVETRTYYVPPLEEQTIPVLSGFNRYFPAGKQEPGQIPPTPPPSKPQKRKAPTPLDINKTPFFIGRDPSYPEELNKLINPLHCELCSVQMNSAKSAKDHYESKAHDRKLTAWIAHNYPENPPAIKRFIIEPREPLGAEALHCQICDLKLTSLAHAKQHYSGRKHKLVASKISNPKGSGYYDAEGKWVRTGSKLTPSLDNDGRFGIGVSFKAEINENSEKAIVSEEQTDSQSLTKSNLPSVTVPDDSLCCKICKISVTSAPQMKTHLEGARHRKNLARLSTDPNADPNVLMQSGEFSLTNIVVDSILATVNSKTNLNSDSKDYSMYRTPSGSYYCQYCNMSLTSIAALEQHIQGKKHMKIVSEQKLTQQKSDKLKKK